MGRRMGFVGRDQFDMCTSKTTDRVLYVLCPKYNRYVNAILRLQNYVRMQSDQRLVGRRQERMSGIMEPIPQDREISECIKPTADTTLSPTLPTWNACVEEQTITFDDANIFAVSRWEPTISPKM